MTLHNGSSDVISSDHAIDRETVSRLDAFGIETRHLASVEDTTPNMRVPDRESRSNIRRNIRIRLDVI